MLNFWRLGSMSILLVMFSPLSLSPIFIQIYCLLYCSSIMLNCNRHLLATFREQVQSVQLTSLHFKTTIFESERVDFNASKCFFPEKYPLPILYRCYAGTPLPCMTGQRTIPHWATEILLRKEMGPFVWYYFLSIYLLQTSYVVV